MKASPPRLIDHYLGSYDVRTRHEAEVSAPVAVTYQAVRDVDLGRSLPVAALFAIRGIPHLLTGKARPSRSITLDTFVEIGFTILAEEAPHELTMGVIGKFWRPNGGIISVAADEFRAFDEPRYAKGIMSFTVDELGPTSSLVATETRVSCTDASSRRKFEWYWRVVGPFSGLIRHVMLAQIKRAAEASGTVT